MPYEKYDPPKMEANSANFITFLDNQIHYYTALIDARRHNGREKEQESKEMENLREELKNLKWKASHIFYDPDPQDRPAKKSKVALQ